MARFKFNTYTCQNIDWKPSYHESHTHTSTNTQKAQGVRLYSRNQLSEHVLYVTAVFV